MRNVNDFSDINISDYIIMLESDVHFLQLKSARNNVQEYLKRRVQE